MKMQLTTIASILTTLTANIAAASGEISKIDNNMVGNEHFRVLDVNVRINDVLVEILGSKEKYYNFQKNPKLFLSERGISPIEIHNIFHENNGGIEARTGVTNCRPYTFSPLSDGFGLAFRKKDLQEVNQNQPMVLNEQNIRILEWFNRNN